MKHLGHTYGGFDPTISERGMTVDKANTWLFHTFTQYDGA
jgi:hypothetical protein